MKTHELRIPFAPAICYITLGDGGCAELFIALTIFALTLLLILVRPGGRAGGRRRRRHGGSWAGGGWADAAQLWAETGSVLAFLAGMLVVGYAADQAGVFAWLAGHAARLSGGSGVRLYVDLYLLGTFVTIWFSLDTTAVVLAPIVYSLVQALGLPPLPFVFAATYVANTASRFFGWELWAVAAAGGAILAGVEMAAGTLRRRPGRLERHLRRPSRRQLGAEPHRHRIAGDHAVAFHHRQEGPAGAGDALSQNRPGRGSPAAPCGRLRPVAGLEAFLKSLRMKKAPGAHMGPGAFDSHSISPAALD